MAEKHFDVERMLKAIDMLGDLKALIDIEAFPGMRKKDTTTIRRHLDEVATIFGEEVANARAGTAKPSPRQIQKLKEEAEAAISADIERQILDSFIPREEGEDD